MGCRKARTTEDIAIEYQEMYERRVSEIERRMKGIGCLYEEKEVSLRRIDSLEIDERTKVLIKEFMSDEINQTITLKANQIRMAIRSIIIHRIKARQTGERFTFTGEVFTIRNRVETWAREKSVGDRPLKEWLFDSAEDIRSGM